MSGEAKASPVIPATACPESEAAKIVAWLRETAQFSSDGRVAFGFPHAADLIEREFCQGTGHEPLIREVPHHAQHDGWPDPRSRSSGAPLIPAAKLREWIEFRRALWSAHDVRHCVLNDLTAWLDAIEDEQTGHGR